MPSLYEITIPVFIKEMKILQTLLAKGVEHTGEGKDKLVDVKLIDDMQGLGYQIQRVSDTAKGLAVRIGGVEPVALEDNEKTMAELHERLSKTIAILEKVKEADMANADTQEVIIKSRSGETKFDGKSYVLNFAIKNFYFHVVTAYALLRKEGVQIGKKDFLGTA